MNPVCAGCGKEIVPAIEPAWDDDGRCWHGDCLDPDHDWPLVDEEIPLDTQAAANRREEGRGHPSQESSEVSAPSGSVALGPDEGPKTPVATRAPGPLHKVKHGRPT